MTLSCFCASEVCAVMGCQRARKIQDEYWGRPADYTKTTTIPFANPCFCTGPRSGEPLCPCQMRGVVVKDGRYVRPEQDLGPVRKA